MTKLLDQAVEVARNLPSDAQDDIARVVLQLAGADDAPPVTLSDDEPFVVFYEVAEDEIVVHAIRHAARDPSGMPTAG